MADIAIGECLLESSLDGDYAEAWRMVSQGMSRAADDIEMHCAATGIQARIVMAQGDVAAGSDMLKNRLETLPAKTSPRLRQNLKCAWLTMELMQGHTADALAWLAAEAPDETKEFIILDPLSLYVEAASVHHHRQLGQTPAADQPTVGLL